MSNTKISIRFFNDREVLAVWDIENAKWFFNVIDIVSILNEQMIILKNTYGKANKVEKAKWKTQK
jgi:hypothetical protein